MKIKHPTRYNIIINKIPTYLGTIYRPLKKAEMESNEVMVPLWESLGDIICVACAHLSL
jgi:hypothetical protein